jgi:hypothetical protein
MRAAADEGGQLGVDQGLVLLLGGDADALVEVDVLQRLEQVKQTTSLSVSMELVPPARSTTSCRWLAWSPFAAVGLGGPAGVA